MNKKRGFTLVEMLAVIALVAVLALVIVPGVEVLIKKSREDAYNIQLKNIIQGAKNWGAENIKKLPKTQGEYTIVTLNDLKMSGFIKGDIKDPRVKKCISNETSIKISKDKNNYKYEIYGTIDTYEEDNCTETSVSNNKVLYNQILKSTEVNDYDKLIEKNPDLAIFPRGLTYFGSNPTNWVRINDNLYRIVNANNENIKIIYQKKCNGSTCTGNGSINSKKYYGFSTDQNNKKYYWNDSGNDVENDMKTWYNSLNIDNFVLPVYWKTGYEINNINSTLISNFRDLFSNSKTPYGLIDNYEVFCSNYDYNNDMEVANSYLKVKTNISYLTMVTIQSNMFTNTNVLDDLLFAYSFVDGNGIVQDLCYKDYCPQAEFIPVISLRPNIKYEKGTGTEDDPFILKP